MDIPDSSELIKKLAEEKESFYRDIQEVSGAEEVYKLKVRYIGAKSFIISILGSVGSLPAEVRPVVGRETNILKKEIEAALGQKEKYFKSLQFDLDLRKDKIDLSLPGRIIPAGKKHIISAVIEEIEEIFIGMGFEIAEGPEVETDYYNFEALNTPPDHPARSLHDTFFISDDTLLRTHTSPVQIRYMEKNTARF